jgi:hypothetical protein
MNLLILESVKLSADPQANVKRNMPREHFKM